jgi:RNA 2',3'-cyclic 3'-phosphodiesterase
MRIFIAINVGEALLQKLGEVLRPLARTVPEARWVRPDSFHLTLQFLGEVPDAQVPNIGAVLARVAQRHPAHRLKVRGSGVFGPLERPKVLWAGVTGALETLESLQKELVRELGLLGFAPDFEVFSPHITLARAKHPRGDPALARCAQSLAQMDFGELWVGEVTLFANQTHMEAMNYVPLAAHALGGA